MCAYARGGDLAAQDSLFQQLADGKRAWEETFDAIDDGIGVRAADCRVLRANRALAGLIGVEIPDLIGVRLCDALPELRGSCSLCDRPDAVVSDRPVPLDLRRSVPEPLVLTVRDYPIHRSRPGKAHLVTVITDVTADRRMQEALIRSEKMGALGEMASGVAHDFNNLLAAILARAELSLLEDPCLDGQRAFESIRRAALDGVATIRRIQEYARVRQDHEARPIDVNAAIGTAVEFSHHKWDGHPVRSGGPIDLVLELGEVPAVCGSPPELREVLINLIFNAVDAMPGGGTLTIGSVLVGDRVIVTVTDTGIGMTDDLQRHAFDPFFSTKGEQGTGLGLSVSYGIVARYGGDIVVQSAPACGATFAIRLPPAPDDQETTAAEADVLARPAPSRILLIDDDARVLAVTAELLRRDGHKVHAYTAPQQALAELRPDVFDYVITDLGMPGLTGWDVAAAIHAAQPDLAVILLTGWHAELSTRQAAERGVSAVLAKPCTLADLRRTLVTFAPEPVARHAPPAPPIQPAALDERRHERAGAPLALASSVPLRILVVDDQPQFAHAVAVRLRMDGHEVAVAATARDGIARGQAEQFDLAIVDLRLPDLSGVDVATALRKLAHPPYVVLTSGTAVAVDDATLIYAADAVLPKPWAAQELQAVLERALQRRAE